jgi:hypothetical protein
MLPAADHFLPAKTEMLPAANYFLPAETEKLPAENQFLPAETEKLPAETEILPAENLFMPAETEILPAYSGLQQFATVQRGCSFSLIHYRLSIIPDCIFRQPKQNESSASLIFNEIYPPENSNSFY